MKKPRFEDIIDIIDKQIQTRKNRWTLSSVAWEDVKQIVFVRIFVKYHLFNPRKGELSHWLGKTISNSIRNILRNNHTKFSRPCIVGCIYNTGGDTCSYTKSGKQCEECPLYKKWKHRKEMHFNVAQALPLETHAQEVDNKPSDFLDIDRAKKIIDLKMVQKLDEDEYEIYKMLYIQGMEEADVGKKLGYKDSGNMHAGYQQILKLRRKFIDLTKQIIDEEDLA